MAKLNLKEVVHDCNGRHIINLIKKFNLGGDEKYCTFISEEDINLSEFKVLLAKRRPVEGEEYYRYRGPKNKQNRFFCHEMLEINKVFSLSEIEFLSSQLRYDVLQYKGSYGCKHDWHLFKGKVIYTPPPTENQMRVLTVNGSPYRSPWEARGYTNY